MSESAEKSAERSAEQMIADDLERVQTEAYGVGAQSIEVSITPDAVFVILDIELAVSERTLMDAGRGDTVKAVRDSFQHAIEPTFRAIVERATGRRVVSFLSTTSIDPLYAVEVFRLGPERDNGGSES